MTTIDQPYAVLGAADQEDPAALRRALADVRALFFFTTFGGDDGTAGEVRRGFAVADAAAAAGVPRVVYSSVGGAERHSGVPHFESKRRVELRLRDLLPVTLVRPTFFMENLAGSLPDADDRGEIVVRMPLDADVPLQMIAVRDIGAVAARALLDPSAVAGETVEIAGDELTLRQWAETAAEVLGRDVRYEALPPTVVDDDDMRAMFTWFGDLPAYRADFAATRALVPDVRDARAWLSEQRAVRARN